jgi:hydrogenase maturation protein HypF
LQTWHIHISGLVQGVGFRPHVFRLALQQQIKGTVCNTTNGVHIYASAEEEALKTFYHSLITDPPQHAVITHHHAEVIAPQQFQEFHIIESEESVVPELLLTPDFAMCNDCRAELADPNNRRYHYPFITCTHCGPRYSVATALPYDRCNTTMEPYEQCWQCKKEYHDPLNRRYYSQTNSCEACGIPLHLYNQEGENICNDTECILVMVKDALANGHTVAVKGVGGYLLLCDATNYFAVHTLRERKNRPSKPFAVLYPSLQVLEQDVVVTENEKNELLGAVAPIVLCRLKESPASGICTEQVAPGLHRLGVMLPYAPLLALIAETFGKPVVATSGNISGSPIIYQDDQALEFLGEIADFVLTHDRLITTPQDDSVVQFTPQQQQRIVLRRSRGLAPGYYPVPFETGEATLLAMGAELKGSFALQQRNHCYISQYLGDQGTYESQVSYKTTLSHLRQLLHADPDVVLVDKHPGYAVSELGRNLAAEEGLPLVEIQHHEAHVAAVLAENQLLETEQPVLGVAFDGTGYGTDGNSWGGEFFTWSNQRLQRYARLHYFPVLLGDKMAREPRLSALSLLYYLDAAHPLLKEKFTQTEWNLYQNQLRMNQHNIQTSSVGRLLDGVASLLGLTDYNSYEGEAAMKLEALALTCKQPPAKAYDFRLYKNVVYWQPVLEQVVADVQAGADAASIAWNVHAALVRLVAKVSQYAGITQLAFSGGVFQNALLVDLLIRQLHERHQLYFHQQLSPNDECISFGQLAWLQLQKQGQSVQKNQYVYR